MLVRLLFLSLASFAVAQSPFRFVAIGDTGSASPGQGRVAEQMWHWRQTNPFGLVVMLGDNIYGTTELTHGGDPKLFPKKFDAYYKRFQDAGVVFHASVGNHDMQTDHAQGEIDDKARFGMLGPDGYYKFSTPQSYNVKGKPLAEFFAINSELHGEKFDAQVKWLAEVLPASNAVWKFVFLHHPLYTVRGQHSPALVLRQAIEKSLHDNHVQFVLAGHNHFYTRMKPVDGLMQMISGGGGRHLAFPRTDQCAELSARTYEFLGVEVFPDKVRFIAIDQYGKMFDNFTADEKYLSVSAPGCPIR
jgi:Calcineurin-like phosphoesterase